MTRSLHRNLSPLLLLVIFVSLVGCSESTPQRRPKIQELTIETHRKEPKPVERAPIPPWQTWSFDDPRPEFTQASQFGEARDFEGEIREYQELERRTEVSPEARLEALTRRMGAMLKLGRSKEVLTEVSRFSEISGRALDQLGPQLSLVVAFAYEHQRDIDQTFAWLSLAQRGGRFDVTSRAREEASRLMRKIRPDAFLNYASRWDSDPFIAALFESEATRRRLGGAPIDDMPPDWFSPHSYGSVGSPVVHSGERVAEFEAEATSPANSAVLGAVLPLTGQYLEHATRVQSGIELAIEKFDPGRRFKVVYGDDGGDAEGSAREYDKLVGLHGANVVLGPLLVKSAELVASRSQSAQVPFLTFTKRPGITALSPVAFRLGVTAESQLAEGIEYARREKQSRRFASLATPLSTDFFSSFRDSVAKSGGEVVGEWVLQPNDPASLQSVLAELSARSPEVIFFGDSLERVLPAIQQIRESTLKDAVLIGPAAWDDRVFIRGYGAVLDGTVFVTPFYAESQRRDVVEFVSAYQQRFGKAPDLLSAQAFDATRLVIEAHQRQEEAFAERLRNVPLVVGVTGQLKVNGDGEIFRRMSVVAVRRGETVEVLAGGVPTGAIVERNASATLPERALD